MEMEENNFNQYNVSNQLFLIYFQVIINANIKVGYGFSDTKPEQDICTKQRTDRKHFCVFSLFFYIYNTYKGKSKIKSRCIRWGSSSIVYINATCLFVKYISFRTMTRIAEIFQKGKKCKLKNYTRSRHRKTRKCTNTLNYKVKHKPRKEMKEKIPGYRQH